MIKKEKTARRLAPSSSRVLGLHRGLSSRILYQISGEMQAPIWTGEEVFSRVLGHAADLYRGGGAG